jgi:hypothetical protein
MYSDMFYIQWHHLAKKDLWNDVYNITINVPVTVCSKRVRVVGGRGAVPTDNYFPAVCLQYDHTGEGPQIMPSSSDKERKRNVEELPIGTTRN